MAGIRIAVSNRVAVFTGILSIVEVGMEAIGVNREFGNAGGTG